MASAAGAASTAVRQPAAVSGRAAICPAELDCAACGELAAGVPASACATTRTIRPERGVPGRHAFHAIPRSANPHRHAICIFLLCLWPLCDNSQLPSVHTAANAYPSRTGAAEVPFGIVPSSVTGGAGSAAPATDRPHGTRWRLWCASLHLVLTCHRFVVAGDGVQAVSDEEMARRLQEQFGAPTHIPWLSSRC